MRTFVLASVLIIATSADVAMASPSSTGSRYRVTLALQPGDDLHLVIRQLAGTYGLQVEEDTKAGNTFVMHADEARVRLLRRSPRVAVVEPLGARPDEVAADAAPGFGNYSYDGAGNITVAGPQSFYYDEYGRLKKATLTATASAEYTYDRYGNILTVVKDGDTANPQKFGVNPATNRMTVQRDPNNQWNTYGQYDGRGNLTQTDAGDRFVYDAANMVNESTVGGVTTFYVYTAGDERLASIKLLGGERTDWTVRDPGGRVLRRFTKWPSGTWTWEEDYIYADGRLLAAEVPSSPKTLHFHLDHLGTPRLITGNGGALVAEHTYYPFGGELTAAAQDNEKLKFTGHERDGDTLDYMHARYYSPKWGRFLSVDPGPSDLRRPQTWNRYVYAENNPVKNVDRDGRLSNPVTGEQGKGKPILHRGGGFGQIRKEQPNVKGSAGGEFGAARAGGRTHKGVDIVAPVGTPLVAAFSGEVYEIRENDKKLGLSVFVKGKNGIIAIYSHLDSTNLKQGDTVKEGEQVGEAGRSGNVMKEQPASEDHVHFQLYGENGKVTDPEEFLNDPKKQEKYRDKEEKQQ